MDNDTWRPRCKPPSSLVTPVPVDPAGVRGPTEGQARGPHWRRTTSGRYVPAAVPRTVEQRILEQSVRLPPGGAVTGWAALRLHGGGFFDGTLDGATLLDVPLVLAPGSTLRRRPGSRFTRERLPPADVTAVHGIRVTTPARATFDEMRAQPDLRSAVVVLDMALAARVLTLNGFHQFLAERAGWPGITRVRESLEHADPGSMSPQESRLRLIWVLDAGYPRPRCNVAVGDAEGRFVGTPDLLCESLAVVGEYDGAFHRARKRHRSDVRREAGFRQCGLETFTVVGEDLYDVPLVVARMRAAVERAAAAGLPRRWSTRR
ncbi:MAG: hypothetical protein JWQ74_1243 [Marmoricola sp.]|nr:hypothetical protein [Marmoricola sp.]